MSMSTVRSTLQQVFTPKCYKPAQDEPIVNISFRSPHILTFTNWMKNVHAIMLHSSFIALISLAELHVEVYHLLYLLSISFLLYSVEICYV